MARIDTLDNFLTDVADSIRTAENSSEPIAASDFDTRISALGGGGNIDEYYTGNIINGSSNASGILHSIKKIPALTFNGTGTNHMFAKLDYVEDIDCSKFDTSNVTTMSNMFQNCYRIPSLDLSAFDTSNVTNMGYMFSGCQALKFLDIRNFTFDNVETFTAMLNYVPTDCLIIVKSQTEKLWFASRFTFYNNVKTVEEYENQ